MYQWMFATPIRAILTTLLYELQFSSADSEGFMRLQVHRRHDLKHSCLLALTP